MLTRSPTVPHRRGRGGRAVSRKATATIAENDSGPVTSNSQSVMQASASSVSKAPASTSPHQDENVSDEGNNVMGEGEVGGKRGGAHPQQEKVPSPTLAGNDPSVKKLQDNVFTL